MNPPDQRAQLLIQAVGALIDTIKDELRAELRSEIRAELAAKSAEAKPVCVMLSLADACQRYGVGRIALKRLIAAGRLRAVERVSRGGWVGQFLHLADCERVLAGRR